MRTREVCRNRDRFFPTFYLLCYHTLHTMAIGAPIHSLSQLGMHLNTFPFFSGLMAYFHSLAGTDTCTHAIDTTDVNYMQCTLRNQKGGEPFATESKSSLSPTSLHVRMQLLVHPVSSLVS